MWPVTVSASTSRTFRPIATSEAARLTAIVVLPTPPLGLKMPMKVPRRDQSPTESGPDWITAPLPSSIVIWRISIASTRQRSASGEYGRVKYSSWAPDRPAAPASRSSVRADTIIRAGISRPGSWSSP